jgi:hypothetical protein
MRSATTLFATSIFFATIPTFGQPISPDHPIVGTWKMSIPVSGGTCDEIYHLLANGTGRVTSAEEESEGEYEISDEPSEKGFYKWADKVTKDNGKKDCAGGITPVGHVATNYIVFHPSGDMFLLYSEQRLETCIGPFVRQKDSEV